MNSKKPDSSKTTSSNIPAIDLENYKTPSFDELRETAERLVREGRMPTLAELLEDRKKIQRWYREDHAARQRGSSKASQGEAE
jgi:hypothetical protein